MSKLNLAPDKELSIPRALFATTETIFNEDIERLENLYSRKDILKTLKTTKERISNTVCDWGLKNTMPSLSFGLPYEVC
ncbi:hypothetical protein [Pricia sp.]|uniref:hypothetical protein n=1 Tax=Pricia sp. TaxID=2268138 RepID=UPI003593B528